MAPMTFEYKVAKFGGSSLSSATRIQNAVRLATSEGYSVVIVSAMGQTTRKLAHIFSCIEEKKWDVAQTLFDDLLSEHYTIYSTVSTSEASLEVYKKLEQRAHAFFDKLLSTPPTPPLKDAFLALGEYFSSQIFQSAWQEAQLIDMAPLILTEEVAGGAAPLLPETYAALRNKLLPMLAAGHKIVGQGFISSTKQGIPTILGYEGSDYTAALVARSLQAKNLTIWTDVAGVYEVDPRLCETAVSLPQMSYAQAACISQWGGRVLHPRTVQPLQDVGIPLYVKSSLEPHLPGTLINDMHAHPCIAFPIISTVTCLPSSSVKPFEISASSFLYKKVTHSLTQEEHILGIPHTPQDLKELALTSPHALITCMGIKLPLLTEFLATLTSPTLSFVITLESDLHGLISLDREKKSVVEKLITFLNQCRNQQVA